MKVNWSADLVDRAAAIVFNATNNKAVFTAPIKYGSVISPFSDYMYENERIIFFFIIVSCQTDHIIAIMQFTYFIQRLCDENSRNVPNTTNIVLQT